MLCITFNGIYFQVLYVSLILKNYQCGKNPQTWDKIIPTLTAGGQCILLALFTEVIYILYSVGSLLLYIDIYVTPNP